MRLLILYVVVIFMYLKINAQSVLSDVKLNVDFEAQVKSLDEFQARFNGIEHKNGTMMVNDSLIRVTNLVSLFDFGMDKKGLTKEQFRVNLNCFVDSVLLNNINFDVLSNGLWAECKCRFKYEGKEKRITLIMQKELYGKDVYRWAIVAAKGLPEAGIINVDKLYPISPVEHEIFFMGLHDLFNENASHAMGYRAKKVRIDQLSVLLSMIQLGVIKFELVEEQTFHYLDVPGFVFTIKEYVRNGTNSGWLINDFQRLNKQEKNDYINTLLGYEK